MISFLLIGANFMLKSFVKILLVSTGLTMISNFNFAKAQEFSGCYMVDNQGNYIDLTESICGITEEDLLQQNSTSSEFQGLQDIIDFYDQQLLRNEEVKNNTQFDQQFAQELQARILAEENENIREMLVDNFNIVGADIYIELGKIICSTRILGGSTNELISDKWRNSVVDLTMFNLSYEVGEKYFCPELNR